jgi:aminoglycoside phosphotransferase (APT) family kinase protein
VFLLDLDGERTVLKVTEDPGWRVQAERELAAYHQFGATLDNFLPEVRAASSDRGAVQVLMAAYEPHPPARAVADNAWIALADRLGQLQQVPVDEASWLRPRPWPSPAEISDALGRWSAYGFAALASRAAEQLAAGSDRQPVWGPVLTHGDCHLGNLLQAPDGSTLWADWQEVCLSSGLGDLVFLWQRAEFDGAHPPREAMTSAYAAARSLPLDNDFRAALAACELRSLLVAWPFYLAYGHQSRQQVMFRRLHQLVGDLPPTPSSDAGGG